MIGNEGIMLPQKAVTPSSSKSYRDFKLNEDFLIVNCGRGKLSQQLLINPNTPSESGIARKYNAAV